MTMKKIACVAFTCLLAAQVSANEAEEVAQAAAVEANASMEADSAEVSQADIDEQNALSDASTKDVTPKKIGDFFDEFADKYSINYGEEENGKVFFNGQAAVSLPSTDPEFSSALNIAFDRALLNMQTKFVQDTFAKLASVTNQKVFSDNSTDAREFEKLPVEGRVAQIFTKIANLTGAKLDSALKEYNLNPEGLTEERKKVLLADSFITETNKTAFGNMQGLVPVQSGMAQTRENHYVVGVIAVMSPKTKQVSLDMRQKRPSLIKGKGHKLRELLPNSDEGFISEQGLRMVYNEKGAPVLISYGQWGYQPDNDAYLDSRLMEIATEQAATRADAAISAFMGTSIDFKSSAKTGEKIENSITEVVQGNDTTLTAKLTKNIISISSQEIIARSDMHMRGLGTLKRWSAIDANGVAYVGVVRFYSHDNVENANRMIAPPEKQSSNAAPAAAKASQTVTRKSRVVNDMDDF